jgi:hypothetical protein
MADETNETAVMPEMEVQGTDVRQATGLALFPAVLKKVVLRCRTAFGPFDWSTTNGSNRALPIRAERRLLILGAEFTIPKFDPNQQHRLKRIESKGQL